VPPPSSVSRASRLSRRSAVAGLAALAATAAATVTGGCTGTSARPVAATSTGARTPGRTTGADASRDVALAATVLRGEQRMLGLVQATARRHPRLRGRLTGTRAAHRAHTALLARAVPRSVRRAAGATPHPRPGTVPDDPAHALAALARAEARLARAGVEHAVQARSGAFARVLGSMTAAAAQQATALAAASASSSGQTSGGTGR
jgi:hypothetical protein